MRVTGVRDTTGVVVGWQHFGRAGNVAGFVRQGGKWAERIASIQFEPISEFGIAITPGTLVYDKEERVVFRVFAEVTGRCSSALPD